MSDYEPVVRQSLSERQLSSAPFPPNCPRKNANANITKLYISTKARTQTAIREFPFFVIDITVRFRI